jgi:methylthioribose-1-phosphate isomerase
MKLGFETIAWGPSGGVRFLDQTLLPEREVYVEVDSIAEMVEAIQALRVRGAPLIGISAAMGLVAAAGQQASRVTPEWIRRAVSDLGTARPTAVNLVWALDRMQSVAEESFRSGAGPDEVIASLRSEAQQIWDEDVRMCEAIGAAGETLVPDGATVMTHCNAGALATGGIGTALAVIYAAKMAGKNVRVVSNETRPLRAGRYSGNVDCGWCVGCSHGQRRGGSRYHRCGPDCRKR